jgi:hypothetical protein
VLERLAKAGIAAGVLVLFMRGRLELHPAHLAIRTLFRSHVIPLADIAMISFGRSGLVFTCVNGRRVVGPMGVGEQTLLSYWLGTRSSGNDIIDTIGDARKRCVRSSVAGGWSGEFLAEQIVSASGRPDSDPPPAADAERRHTSGRCAAVRYSATVGNRRVRCGSSRPWPAGWRP